MHYNKTAMISERPIAHSNDRLRRWKTTVLASAAVVALLGASLDAQAVALGAVTVKSALGEPLRAEIEVQQMSSEDAANFKASVASQQAFRAAGVEYTPALAGARVTLQHRANGQAYLRLEGDRPVSEPFLSVVIQANWADGSMVRDYTMLIDPPGHAAPPPVSVTQPQTAPDRPAAGNVQIATQVTPPAVAPAPAAQPAEAQRPVRRAAAAPEAAAASGDGRQVAVRRGDTASSIVSAHRIEGVSLDQALVALLRSNPRAFIGNNVNRMRAGVVLNMPSAEQASAIAPRAARREIVAQVRDFNAYRSNVAQNVRNVDTGAAKRSVSGEVQAQVQDNRAPAPGDRLTMTAPGSGSSANAGIETAAAKAREAKEQADRIAELNKNRDELLRLQASSGKPAAAASAASPAGIKVPANVSPVSPPAPQPAKPPESSADNTASTDTTEDLPATSTEDEASKPAPTSPSSPTPEPDFLDSLADNSLPLFGGLAALIAAGLGVWFWRKGKRKNSSRSRRSFIESGLHPDSFFGASGGQKINTKESGGNSSLTYSASQLDAAGDVDPVAEADVYLAYGRDVQAEEILKEAVRTHSGRVAIHRKLAEIYAKRRDARALQGIAVQAYEVTYGKGPDWQAICSLGSELDPINPLYKPGGKPLSRARASAPSLRRAGFGADTEPQAGPMTSSKLGDSDLQVPESTQPQPAKTVEDNSSVDLDLDMEFTPPAEPPPILRAAPATTPSADSKMIEFDMDALSDDSKPDSSSESPDEHPADVEDSPLATKLALAEEFLAIGDKDGARNLLKEVAAEATDALKARAERFLAELN